MVPTQDWMKPIFFAAMMVILPPRAGRAQVNSTTLPAPAASAPAPLSALEVLQNGATQESRDLAARKLVALRQDSMRPQLVEILKTNRSAQLAIARALAVNPWLHRDFIDPLFAIVDSGASVRVGAAAQALARYQDNPDVLARLLKVADSTKPSDVRVQVIRALAGFDQKAAAQKLIELQQHSPDDAIVRASSDALLDMTGLTEPGHDPSQWKTWWDRVSKGSDRDFHDEIIRERGQNYERLLTRHQQMENAVAILLSDLYTQAPATERTAILLRFIESPIPSIRAVGANQVAESRDTPEGAPKEAMREVRTLLDDAAPQVRVAAAAALFNDQDSAPAMIAQLSAEPDDLVRATLIHSLAPLRDPVALALMVKFAQNDPSFRVKTEAVEAIQQGAETVAANPEMRRSVIAALQPIAQRAAPPGAERLRIAVIAALSALRETDLRPLFQSLVNPNEAPEVRKYALLALGNLKDPNLGDQIASYLNDPNPEIRAAAVGALGTVAQPLYLQQLLDRMNDSDPNVKATAWQTLQTWMPELPKDDLAAMADGLKTQGDQAKQLIALLLLRDRLQKDIQNAPSDAQRELETRALATQQQVIGDVMMQVQHPADAAEQYKSALDYWKGHNGAPAVLDALSEDVVRAQLAARKWADATAFAEGFIQQPNPSPTEEVVSKEFKVAADNLQKSDDPRAYMDAMALFAAVDKMSPPLNQYYRDQLDAVRQQIRQKHTGAAAP
ncbi:MAG: HEAT repeat domain-containing protein [Planctomycetota bacterium]|nr:HEAT repeat domain-containing protein [Planctomycetota bacterium]